MGDVPCAQRDTELLVAVTAPARMDDTDRTRGDGGTTEDRGGQFIGHGELQALIPDYA